MIIPVVFATDDNYVLPLCVAMKSLIDNKNIKDELDIYIFYSQLKQESFDTLNNVVNNKAKISFICVDEYTKGANFYVNDKVTIATYYRFFAPIILSKYKKVFYLDCDIIIKKSLSDFYNIDMGDNIIAGPHFIDAYGKALDYFNAGVILINVEEYNKNNICQKSIDYINTHRNLEWLDETVLNEMCKGKVCFIDTKYNFQTTYAKEEKSLIATKVKRIIDIVVLHYTDKPWKYVNTIFAKYWWNTVKTLPKDLQVAIQDKFFKNQDPNGQVFGYYKYYFANPVKKFFIKAKIKIQSLFKNKK